jgi:1-acyl-sn-glycerol-3-phosphate acyltransferase
MIQVKKSLSIQRALTASFNRRLRRSFAAIHVRGLDAVRQEAASSPLILYANNGSWWDAVLPIFLSSRILSHDAYAIMDAKRLEASRWLQRAGAFSVESDQDRAAESFRQVVRLLEGTNRVLWIHAQHGAPVEFNPGLAFIAANVTNVRTAAAACSYEFIDKESPEVFIRFDEPTTVDTPEEGEREDLINLFTSRLGVILDEQHESILMRDLADYTCVLHGR